MGRRVQIENEWSLTPLTLQIWNDYKEHALSIGYIEKLI